ncbi:leukemia inhibitory factor receptor isoform X2 [Cyclopterus lumpus]|uniref:leukemia inhibitory factor receptor isoform X2 n=1 Tax=Cyclopterus lumpus TaxID=8103 RepID=UPI0014872FEC|nr:leukemia inhibitory factor receptor isoform X2 [Cyclopterus lumpus]
MVGGGFHLDFLHSKGSAHASHLHVLIFGLIFVSYYTHVQASTSVSCRSPNISSKYQHCGIHPDGVHDLDCFGKHKPSGMKKCVWKPGKHPSEKTYTLIIQQQLKRGIYCNVYDNITEFSENIKLYENYNMVAEVFENSQQSTNCTKAVFDGSPKSLLRCGPPYKVSFSRHSGRLVVNVSWPQEDLKFIKYYFVSYNALGSMSWNKSVRSQNATTCTLDNLNSSLGYTARIQCVTSDKCPQCAVSEAYTVRPELTTRPLIVKFEETDIRGRKGFRLLSLTWKFSGKEPHDGYDVSVGKASGEAPCERISTTQPEIRLILSYSAYHLNIRAVNNVSTSPAVSRAIPRREDVHGMGDGKMNVTVHSNTSFTVYWRDNLIRHYVCYSVEWMKKGQEATHMSFYQNTHNYRTLSLLREPLEPYKRYSITLHTRQNKDTCNMKHVNNSESTYGRTQFYSTEGLVLQWSSIPEEDIRGFLLGYTIYYNEYHHGRSSTERNITVDPMRNRYELGHLKGGTVYEFQMSGFNRAGAGVRSIASLFKTNDQGFSNLTGFIIISAAVATVLIFAHPIIKRAKVMLWPSIPNPGKSNAMQNIEEPCELELMESLNTPRVEEWDTSSLQVVEKEDATPSSASPSTLPLLGASEEDSPETTRNRIQRDPEDATGDIPPYSTEETFSDIQRTDNQSCPLAFSGGYTTLDMFQQANTSVAQTTESKPEEPDSTVVKSGLDYVGQYGTSPILDSKMSTIL